MSRKREKTNCDEKVLLILQKLANSQTEEARMVLRSKIILACLTDDSLQKIAKELNLRPATIIKWRNRFNNSGIAGLHDNPRPGKPKVYGKDIENSILSLLEKEPPAGMASWDGPTVAKELGISDDAVWRFLKKQGICLSRQRTWCISTDPHFAAKAADVVGLYLNPPERAVVIAVDEKPTIQALERRTGYVVTHDKKIVRGLQSTYKRNGTVNLFAALEIASGRITGKVTKEKKRKDFLEFMEELTASYSEEQELHVIMDNHCIHKRAEGWLEKHKNVYFHYTPTSASWMNMVEIWFGIFTRKVLRGASFSSTDDLTNKILTYIEAYKEQAHPFVWKKRDVVGSQLRNSITNLCN